MTARRPWKTWNNWDIPPEKNDEFILYLFEGENAGSSVSNTPQPQDIVLFS